MRYICAFYLCLTLCLTAKNETRSEPFTLKSANGSTVKVVAVYSMDSEGLEFSPLPNGALIGSNTLATLTTPWENIDTASLETDTRLADAYKRAIAGETVKLDIGPHFNDLSDIKKRIKAAIPDVTIHYSNGRKVQISLSKFITDKDRVRVNHWAVSDHHKQNLVSEWSKIYDELESMVYRPEVSKLQYELKKSMAIIRRIDPKSGTFNETAAKDIARLFNQL